LKTLTLVRHAKSSWKNPSWSDIERPLNKRGLRDAPLIGKKISSHIHFPITLFSSDAVRAFVTSKKIARELNIDETQIECFNELYHASSGEILNFVKKIDNALDNIMLFLHNPGITDFANYFSSEYYENIPTCGVISFSFEVDLWKDIDKKNCTQNFYLYPKQFKKND